MGLLQLLKGWFGASRALERALQVLHMLILVVHNLGERHFAISERLERERHSLVCAGAGRLAGSRCVRRVWRRSTGCEHPSGDHESCAREGAAQEDTTR